MSARPELVFEGRPRPRLAQALKQLWAYQTTALAFAERDLRVKYKQAVLGVGWACLQPLAFMAIFTVMLGHLAKVPGGGVPYAAFSLSALVPWTFLQSSLSFAANSLLNDGALVRKVYFPRELPVLGAILATGVDFAIGLTLFFLAGPLLGAKVSATWLLAPCLLVILAILATGVGLVLAALNVYYRDFRFVVPVTLQLWLLASPVAYPMSVVPHEWRILYVILNPAAGVIDGFRRVLALGELPNLVFLGLSLASSLLIAGAGYRIFKSREPNFADVV